MLNLKKRIGIALASLAILAVIAGSSGIVADSLGLSVTSPAHACHEGSGSGGGC